MNKFVIELQKSCLDISVGCTELLWKAYFIAKKLDIHELESFCNSEIYGYRNLLNKLPSYRYVLGEYRILNIQSNSWNPVAINGNLYGYQRLPLVDSIAELETFFKSGIPELEVAISPEIQGVFKNEIPNSDSSPISCFFPQPQIANLLQSVRILILSWAIELEKKGILGDDYMFNDKEKENAQNVSNITFNGDVKLSGNYALGQMDGSTVTVQNTSMNIEDVKNLIKLIAEELGKSGISEEEQKKVSENIESIKEAIADNDVVKIGKCLRFIKDMYYNVMGNLIASGIVLKVTQLLNATGL